MTRKILLVCANPRGTDALRLGEEERTLKEAIRLSRFRDLLAVTVLNAATIDDLRRELLGAAFDIVHFSGHGTYGGLVFEDSEGRLMVPDSSALAELLARRGVKTALLNACYSLTVGAFGSKALDFTIAMEGPIADRSAIEFARGFYDSIGAGRDVPDAYAEGLSCCRLKRLELTAVLLRSGETTSTATVDRSEPPEPSRSHAQADDMTGHEVPETPRSILLGVAIDTSGSMRGSIRNNRHEAATRLSAVRDGLSRLASSFRAELTVRADAGRASRPDDARVFVYAFGLRHTAVGDLLTLIRATEEVDVRAHIETSKRHHEAEARQRYAGFSGISTVLKGYGLGRIVDDLEQSARAGAENAVRHEIAADVADMLLRKTRALGDTTLAPSDLARLLERSGERSALADVEPMIYGETPMRALAAELVERFQRHPAKAEEERLLFVVSDGDSTDGDPRSLFGSLRERGVTVVTCYVTDDDVANPRFLVASPHPAWRSGARVMFDAASEIDERGPLARQLLGKGWSIEHGAHLFVQVNHSDILGEFIQIAGKGSTMSARRALPEGR